jgi:integrase
MQDVERPSTHEKEVQIPQIDDFEKLLNRVTGTRYFGFVVFAAAAGCRRGEQLALKWSDIDFKTGLVTISKSVSQTSAGLDIKTPKSGKTRFVRISPETIEVLLEHRAQVEHEKELFGEDYKDNNLVFCTPNGDYYQPNQITNRIAEFMQQAGVDASLHSLRHFNASTMLSKKVPLPVVSKRLGHANSQITLKVYSHVIKNDEVIAADLWDEATADVVSRARRQGLSDRSGSADVRFCYVDRARMA